MRKLNSLWTVSLVAWASAVAAVDYPTLGTVHGTVDNDAIRFDCKPDSKETISCDFIQVSTTHAAKESDWPKRKRAAETSFKKMTPAELKEELSGVCKFTIQLEGILAGTVEPPDPTMWAALSAEEVKFFEKSAVASKRMCDKPSAENLAAIGRVSFERELRTCKISINPFTQRFRKSSGGWSVISEPTGECGIVQLSKFEKAENIFWNYTSRKAVTNPQNEMLLGIKCSDLDEGVYPYVWNGSDKHMQCDFIDYE
ncbi:hypothetical protein NCG89_09195 [Spongiibacter taiwanensis]|uniref:hypothetical protein n=1 Tax=Spongiibacter taiwanensis TaxID=1748242 RepID=UPI0020351669|nr:hypothetical protein [Spongiibacter taiwanensis]USA41694.1 hypothetical protein NCG89_09195 [Spongiibacter taiwanensis]